MIHSRQGRHLARYLLFTIAILLTHSVVADTIVDTDITTDTTWDATGSPYLIQADVSVKNSVLTITQGVTVEFNGYYSLTIASGSTLHALGEQSAEINFQLAPGAASGNWNQIVFNNGAVNVLFNSDGSYASGSIFRYVTITNTAPSSPNSAAIESNYTTPYFEHITIQNNQYGAIQINDPSKFAPDIKVIIKSSTFTNNNLSSSATSPVISAFLSGTFILQDSTVSNNGYAGDSTVSSTIKCSNCAGVQITNNTISNNRAKESGGIYLENIAGDLSQNMIEGNLFSENLADDATVAYSSKGGAINISKSLVTIRNNLFDNNKSNNEAGAVYISNTAGVITKNIFSNNTGAGSTGAVRVDLPTGDFDVSQNIFYANTAQTGHGAGFHTHNNPASTIPDTTHVFNILNNLFIDNSVLPLLPGVKIDGRNEFGDCIYIDNSDARIVGNAFTGQGFKTCVYLANVITGGITNNSFYGNYNELSLIKLNNVTADPARSAEPTAISQNNFLYSNWTSKYVDRFNVTVSNTMNLSNNWWEVTSDLADFLPPATATSPSATPNPNAPISAPQIVTADYINGNIAINWDAIPEPDMAVGYRIYWVVDGEYLQFDNVIDAGLVTSYIMTPTVLGSYTFAVTAYKSAYISDNDDPATFINENQTQGTESWYSPAIAAVDVSVLTDPTPSPTPSPTPGSGGSSGGGGGGGGGGAMNSGMLIMLFCAVLVRRRYFISHSFATDNIAS